MLVVIASRRSASSSTPSRRSKAMETLMSTPACLAAAWAIPPVANASRPAIRRSEPGVASVRLGGADRGGGVGAAGFVFGLSAGASSAISAPPFFLNFGQDALGSSGREAMITIRLDPRAAGFISGVSDPFPAATLVRAVVNYRATAQSRSPRSAPNTKPTERSSAPTFRPRIASEPDGDDRDDRRDEDDRGGRSRQSQGRKHEGLDKERRRLQAQDAIASTSRAKEPRSMAKQSRDEKWQRRSNQDRDRKAFSGLAPPVIAERRTSNTPSAPQINRLDPKH